MEIFLDEKKKKMFENLKKPEICDSLESVQFALQCIKKMNLLKRK